MKFKKIRLPFKIKKSILALGSNTKNTICFAKDKFAYLSQAHADLRVPRDLLDFEKEAKYFLKKNPKIIAYDLHPEYQSTKYAHELRDKGYELKPIQHHHAHIASLMIEKGLKNEKVIGVAFDGTGLGSDNTLWGAEFLVCNYKNFVRKAHFKEIPLVGQEMAIIEPWRLTAIWLYSIYKDKFLDLKIDFIKHINKRKWSILKNIYLKKTNSPLASSAGRLFDAVASLVLSKYSVSFEAGLAIELERLAKSFELRYPAAQANSYHFKVIKNPGGYIINPEPMFKDIVFDLKAKEPQEKIAYHFHLTVAKMIKDTCVSLRKENKINKVLLSGGVFQNKLLLTKSLDLLYKEDFTVLTCKELSCNDSSVSLGQAVIANF